MTTAQAGIGFVGLGKAAGRLADAALTLSNGRSLAAFSSNAAKAQEFAAQHGIARFYTHYEDLLADDSIAGVVIASANVAHLAQATRAAAAGKHVFCEKPMGRDSTAAASIVDACNDATVVLGVGYHLRYHPLIRQARAAIAAGALGRVRLIRGHFYVGSQYDRSGWRSDAVASGGGALVRTGVHIIDAFHFLLDEAATTASMLCDALPVEEVCSAMLTFPSGAVGLFDTARVIPNAQSNNSIEIYGERGRCCLMNVLGGWVPQGAGFIENETGRVDLTTDLTLNLYAEELSDWIASFLGATAPLADGLAGLLAARVMDALYRNALTSPGPFAHELATR